MDLGHFQNKRLLMSKGVMINAQVIKMSDTCRISRKSPNLPDFFEYGLYLVLIHILN